MQTVLHPWSTGLWIVISPWAGQVAHSCMDQDPELSGVSAPAAWCLRFTLLLAEGREKQENCLSVDKTAGSGKRKWWCTVRAVSLHSE